MCRLCGHGLVPAIVVHPRDYTRNELSLRHGHLLILELRSHDDLALIGRRMRWVLRVWV